MPKKCPRVPTLFLYILLYDSIITCYKVIGAGTGDKNASKNQEMAQPRRLSDVHFVPKRGNLGSFSGTKIFQTIPKKPSNHAGLRGFLHPLTTCPLMSCFLIEHLFENARKPAWLLGFSGDKITSAYFFYVYA